ncbi:MAG: DUF2062 domain-containing protein [Steroidobacter sp.]
MLVDQRCLWRWSRRTVSRGAAVGVFIGLLLPFGQIPAAAACAAYLRTHLPATVACTWITNPVTTVPVYYGIYLFGAWLLGSSAPVLAASGAGWTDRVIAIGLPLLVGTPIVALVSIPVTYLGVNLVWRAHLRRRRPGIVRGFRRALP